MRGAPPPLRQHLLEKLAGEARFTLGAALRSSGVDKLAAHIAALGAEVDDVIRDLYDVEIVLDDDDGVPRFDEAVKDVYEPVHVGDVQSGCRLVEHIHGAARAAL